MYPWPDWMTPYVPEWLIGIAVVLAALWLVVTTSRKLWDQLWTSWLRPLRDFLDDWNGEPARDGFSGRPGVMSRLESLEEQGRTSSHKISALEDTGKQTAIKIDEIQMNVKPNGGESAHDGLMKAHRETRGMVAEALRELGTFRAEYGRALRTNHPDYNPDATD